MRNDNLITQPFGGGRAKRSGRKALGMQNYAEMAVDEHIMHTALYASVSAYILSLLPHCQAVRSSVGHTYTNTTRSVRSVMAYLSDSVCSRITSGLRNSH